MVASLLTYMDRNLKNLNFLPYWPTLCWRNRIGPLDVSLMAIAMPRNRGRAKSKTSKLPTISIDLFTRRGNRFGEVSYSRSSKADAVPSTRRQSSQFSGNARNDSLISWSPDCAFIEVRQELGADDAAEEQISRESQRDGGPGDGGPAETDGETEGRAIHAEGPPHHRVMPLLHVLSEQEAAKDRRDGHGKEQRAQQRERDRPGHGLEQAALHALQGEDGDIGGDDDADGIDHGTLHFVRGVAHGVEVVGVCGLGTAEVADDILDHHHGAFHHHAEIERAERKQVGRNVIQVEADGREQQRKRNSERDDERAARVAQEHEKDQGHQDDALGEVVQHRVRGEVNQDAAVEEGNDLHAGRQDAVVELVDLGVDGVEGFVGVGAFAQKDDAFHDVAVISDLAVGVVDRLADLPEADLGALCDSGDVLDADGGSALRFDEGFLDVAHGPELAHGADVDLLQAGFDKAAAGVDVVGGQLLLHLTHAEAVGDQLVGIDAHLVFAGSAAEAHDIDDIGNGFELFFQDPVFERLELHEVVAGIGAVQRVPVDLADGAVVGADLRLQAAGQSCLGDALEDRKSVG